MIWNTSRGLGGRWRTRRDSDAWPTAAHPGRHVPDPCKPAPVAGMGGPMGARRRTSWGVSGTRVRQERQTRPEREAWRPGSGESKTYTFLQAGRIVTVGDSASGGAVGFGRLGPEIPPTQRGGHKLTQRVRLCGPAYPKGVGVIQGAFAW